MFGGARGQHNKRAERREPFHGQPDSSFLLRQIPQSRMVAPFNASIDRSGGPNYDMPEMRTRPHW